MHSQTNYQQALAINNMGVFVIKNTILKMFNAATQQIYDYWANIDMHLFRAT